MKKVRKVITTREGNKMKNYTTAELIQMLEVAKAQRTQGYKLRVGRNFIQAVNHQIREFSAELAERGVEVIA